MNLLTDKQGQKKINQMMMRCGNVQLTPFNGAYTTKARFNLQ